ncbi:MAG: phosphoribosylformylglycinamidine cyclo-ligase [Pseudomonadota bacterium]|jgi:phosphoribosylformylglycinamidine cyclo-ligase|nr:phosphoribosylformylglycinamidine cyclo-ligase [Syntrophobacterales bacterium]MDI9555905.1 phosphoribosylformylglycinamidine cyclo-ligase [Pseudomonadota bacterium]NLX31101.1 phosphoribosylformylglycinamidine cyclo-ligase [Deltaproteobacteria bacterium]HNU85219.1 phosphoribosylformylglycinamidine cyclo-ligase [Syntrophales bacterium]HNZ34502.1 phosphoribosylformylglycinamidine cyclo-ligase [Syntrophales bacterium]
MGGDISYKDSGVDIDKGNRFVDVIKPLVKTTFRKEVMGGIGAFGGLFHLDKVKYKDPILVASTDGVGTKLNVARMMNRYNTIGIDLVAMSVNDVLVQGAEPLFFLDYIASGSIDIEVGRQLIEGVVKGCKDAGCALLGGETAEMPGFYGKGDYELVGFCVGIVEADKLIDGSRVGIGDKIIGLASSGIHSNGLSLARKVFFDRCGLQAKDPVEGLLLPVGEELLTPTRIYVKSVLNLLKNFNLKGLVHITGGGFYDNIPRILPERCSALIHRGSWPELPVFQTIRKQGGVDDAEMFRVFNMGIGMMIIADSETTPELIERLGALGEKAYLIGSIEKRRQDAPSVIIA